MSDLCVIRFAGRQIVAHRQLVTLAGWEVRENPEYGGWYADTISRNIHISHTNTERLLACALSEGLEGEKAVLRAIQLGAEEEADRRSYRSFELGEMASKHELDAATLNLRTEQMRSGRLRDEEG